MKEFLVLMMDIQVLPQANPANFTINQRFVAQLKLKASSQDSIFVKLCVSKSSNNGHRLTLESLFSRPPTRKLFVFYDCK